MRVWEVLIFYRNPMRGIFIRAVSSASPGLHVTCLSYILIFFKVLNLENLAVTIKFFNCSIPNPCNKIIK